MKTNMSSDANLDSDIYILFFAHFVFSASITTPVPVQAKNRGHHCEQPLRGDNVIFHWDIDIEEDNASIIPDGIGLHARCIDVGTFRLMGSIRLLCKNGIWLGKLPVCQKTEEDGDYTLLLFDEGKVFDYHKNTKRRNSN